MLKQFGLKYLKLADKINLAKAKYNKANQGNLLGKFIAQLIAEELQLTSWNLTQSYINAKKSQGRLCLTGFGDPTNGHGGLSFVKQPLKISRHEKDGTQKPETKEDDSQPQKAIVTGTSADLRRLKMFEVKKILIKHGYNGDLIEKLSRWEKIDLLRELSNKLGNVENDDDKEILKFARSLRETTKMQREKYQKDINKLFSILYSNLSVTNEAEISEKIPHSLMQESTILGDKQPALNLFHTLFQKEKEKSNKSQKNSKKEKNNYQTQVNIN